MFDSVRQNFLDFSTEFEGRIPFMYLDLHNPPLVTIGIGNLIDPIARARQLSGQFTFKSDSTIATQDDIDADWNAVHSNPGLAPSGFKAFDPLTKLMLPDDAIDTLVLQTFDQYVATLKNTTAFAGIDSWPADAQLGLLSMAWGMGPAFGQKPGPDGFPIFRAKVAALDWTGAAQNCHMNDTGNPGLKPRNSADHVLFVNAAQTVAQQGDPSILQYTISGLRSTLKQGAVGNDLDFLQTRLSALQYIGTASGTFDAATTAAVKAFQSDQGLGPADGIVGPITWAALGTAVPASSPVIQ